MQPTLITVKPMEINPIAGGSSGGREEILKFECVYKSPKNLVKIKILIVIRGMARDSAFVKSCQGFRYLASKLLNAIYILFSIGIEGVSNGTLRQ